MSENDRKKLTQDEAEKEAEKSRIRKDQLLEAIHRLEGSLASAAPGREREWVAKVNECLSLLGSCMRERIAAKDGLLSDIELAAPHLWNTVKRLRAEYERLERQVGELRAEFQDPTGADGVDYRDVRERIGWLLTALRHQQSRETDLIFEVYSRDIGVGD